MTDQCVIVLSEYDSISGYFKTVHANGKRMTLEYPFRVESGATTCDWYVEIVLAPGDYILIREYKSDDHYETYLAQIPTDSKEFIEFKEYAERVAGLQVYERICGYKRIHKQKGLVYDYSNDFSGEYLRRYLVKSWKLQINPPQNIEQALKTLV